MKKAQKYIVILVAICFIGAGFGQVFGNEENSDENLVINVDSYGGITSISYEIESFEFEQFTINNKQYKKITYNLTINYGLYYNRQYELHVR